MHPVSPTRPRLSGLCGRASLNRTLAPRHLNAYDSLAEDNSEAFSIRGTATDHLGEPFDITGAINVQVIDNDGTPPPRAAYVSVSPEVVYESDLSGGQTVSVTVTATVSGDGPLDTPITLTPSWRRSGSSSAIACPSFFSLSDFSSMTIPSGVNRPSAQQQVTLASTSTSSSDLTRDCQIWVNHGFRGDAITIVPDEDPFITDFRLSAVGRTSSPTRIFSRGETMSFRFSLNRQISFTPSMNDYLSFRIGNDTRTTACRSEAAGVVCQYLVQTGDLDLDGFSLDEGALNIGASTFDKYDPSIALTLDTTIPAALVGVTIGEGLSLSTAEGFPGDRYEVYVVHDGHSSWELAASLQSLQEDAGATEITVTATRFAGPIPAADISIPIVLTDLTTTAADYTVTGEQAIPVLANTVSGSTTLTFTPTDDGVAELHAETVRIEGAESDYYVVGTDLDVLDLSVIELSATPASVAEDGGAATVTVTAELSDPSSESALTPDSGIPYPARLRDHAGRLCACPGPPGRYHSGQVRVPAPRPLPSRRWTTSSWRATRPSCWSAGTPAGR